MMEKSCQNYTRKLKAKLKWAFQLAKETNEKESQHQKHYYDKCMSCQKLAVGDLVLVKQKGSSGTYKIDDKWEINPYRVLEQIKNDKGHYILVFKLLELVKTGAPRERILHHNMLYPYRSVQDGTSPLLIKANLLMDIYFSER